MLSPIWSFEPLSGPLPPPQRKGHEFIGGGEGEEQGADGGDLMIVAQPL